MPTDILGELALLSQTVRLTPDARPEWLRALDTDPTSVYYRYFYVLAQRYGPRSIVEIGTYEGKSAAHLAAGNREGRVTTLDVSAGAKTLADALMIPNLVALVCNSLQAPQLLKWIPDIDLLFIDGHHECHQVQKEYIAFRPFVREGGLIFFDDIHINAGMDHFWSAIPDRKVELPELHYTGFGVAQKTAGIQPDKMA